MGLSDIAFERIKDPGEKFPWQNLAKKKLCKWHTLNEDKIKIYRNIKLDINDEIIFLCQISLILII